MGAPIHFHLEEVPWGPADKSRLQDQDATVAFHLHSGHGKFSRDFVIKS